MEKRTCTHESGCRFPVWNNSDLCVFHHPDRKNKETDFIKEWNSEKTWDKLSKQHNNYYKFVGWIFPKTCFAFKIKLPSFIFKDSVTPSFTFKDCNMLWNTLSIRSKKIRQLDILNCDLSFLDFVNSEIKIIQLENAAFETLWFSENKIMKVYIGKVYVNRHIKLHNNSIVYFPIVKSFFSLLKIDNLDIENYLNIEHSTINNSCLENLYISQYMKIANSTFLNNLIFNTFTQKINQPESITLEKITTQYLSPGTIIFENIDMSKISLIDAPIDKMEFHQVAWNESNKGTQIILADEKNDLKDQKEEKTALKKHYQKLHKVYAKLRQYYEDQKDFSTAEKLYFSEMEAKYKSESKSTRFYMKLYKFFAGYGYSLQKPLYSLFSIFLVFSLIYFLLTFSNTNLSQSIASVLNYSLKAGFDFKISLTLNIHNNWLKLTVVFLTLIQKLSSWLLIYFFALAMRRRFKR